MVFSDHEETRSVTINTRGITRISFIGVYTVGQAGQAGGLVFFDKGSYSNGWRYLEAAPASTEFSASWGNEHINGTSTALGFGKTNTQAIVRTFSNSGHVGRAAQVCDLLVYGGYDDWFMPSSDELDWMYKNLKDKGLGGFTNDYYWSSSQSDSISWSAWRQNFRDGRRDAPNIGSPKNNAYRVRAIRQF